MTRAEALNNIWNGLGLLIDQAEEGSELKKNLSLVRRHIVALVTSGKAGGLEDKNSKMFHGVQEQYVNSELTRAFTRKKRFDKMADRLSDKEMLAQLLED